MYVVPRKHFFVNGWLFIHDFMTLHIEYAYQMETAEVLCHEYSQHHRNMEPLINPFCSDDDHIRLRLVAILCRVLYAW